MIVRKTSAWTAAVLLVLCGVVALAQMNIDPPVPVSALPLVSRVNQVSEGIIRKRLVRCPTKNANPSYFELKAMGYRLVKLGKAMEAKQCFMDAMSAYLGRVGLYGQTAGEEPSAAEASEYLPVVREQLRSSPYLQLPAGLPRDARLGLGQGGADSSLALQDDGGSTAFAGGPAPANRPAFDPRGPSMLDTVAPPAGTSPAAAGAAGRGGSGSAAYPSWSVQTGAPLPMDEAMRMRAGGDVASLDGLEDMVKREQQQALAPRPTWSSQQARRTEGELSWRHSSLDDWMAQPSLQLRTVQLFDAQLVAQKRLLGAP